MGSRKNYDEEYKAQAVKLANEKGGRTRDLKQDPVRLDEQSN